MEEVNEFKYLFSPVEVHKHGNRDTKEAYLGQKSGKKHSKHGKDNITDNLTHQTLTFLGVKVRVPRPWQ